VPAIADKVEELTVYQVSSTLWKQSLQAPDTGNKACYALRRFYRELPCTCRQGTTPHILLGYKYEENFMHIIVKDFIV